jgi:hypothetical protein
VNARGASVQRVWATPGDRSDSASKWRQASRIADSNQSSKEEREQIEVELETLDATGVSPRPAYDQVHRIGQESESAKDLPDGKRR